MAKQVIAHTGREAFKIIRTRLKNDMRPLWSTIRTNPEYSPFWLLTRELFPVAESIGDLLYDERPSTNLERVLDEQYPRINSRYAGKGAMIAMLYRHSLIHQDEPRSLFSNGITLDWRFSFGDGGSHLSRSVKNSRRRNCTISFDLHQFYEDTLALLVELERQGPHRGVAGRYNAWTFMNISARSTDAVAQIRDFYHAPERPDL